MAALSSFLQTLWVATVRLLSKLSRKVLNARVSEAEEERWIDEQGPYCPACVEYIKEHHGDYTAVIFMTYLYYITAKHQAFLEPQFPYSW